MNQKIDKIGRISAVISSLVLMALMLNLWILEAIADEQNANVPQALHEPTQKPHGKLWDRMYHVFAPELQAGESVPIAEAQFERSMFPMKGRPVAYVLHDELYLVNRYGKILGTADSYSMWMCR